MGRMLSEGGGVALVVEIPLYGQLKIEYQLIPVEAKGHAGLVLVIFIDQSAALGEVGFVAEAHTAAGVSLVEFHPQHPQRVFLTELDPTVTHIHQPLQQGEEILLVGLYRLGDGLFQLGRAGKGAIQGVAGLYPFLGHKRSSLGLPAGFSLLAAMWRSGGDATVAHQGSADVLAHLAEALDLVEGGRDAAIDLILPVAEIRIHQLHQFLGAADAGVVWPALEGIRLVERKFRLHGVDDLLHRGNAVRLSVHGSFPGSGMGESLYPCQKRGQ